MGFDDAVKTGFFNVNFSDRDRCSGSGPCGCGCEFGLGQSCNQLWIWGGFTEYSASDLSN
jgi:hypothetical protein